MEEKCSPPPPYLVFIHGEDNEKLSICSIAGNGGVLVKEVPQKFRDRKFNFKADRSGGEWLIVWGKDDTDYSLWNPLTAEIVTLPELDLQPESEITARILTSPPGNPNCTVLLYERKKSLSRYWRIGDRSWTEQLLSYDYKAHRDDCLEKFVSCNGRIYCRTSTLRMLVVIDIELNELVFKFSNTPVPNRNDYVRWHILRSYLVESCGELFVVSLLYDGNADFPQNSVGAVEIFRFDVSLEKWSKVESFKDRAFFISPSSQFSCPAPQPGIRANHVYVQLSEYDDISLYSFNMEDKTVLFTNPYPSLSEEETRFTSLWIMSDSRLSDVDEETEFAIDMDESGKEAKSNEGKLTVHSTIEGDFGMLDSDIQSAIASRLKLQDYLRFRAVNSWFRSLAPPIKWTKSALEGFEGYDSFPPLLMFWEIGDSICNFIDPLCHERYFMSIPDELENAVMLYSKDGWSVVIQGDPYVSLCNPFSKTTIPLPEKEYAPSVFGCGISSSPDSPESDCVVVLLSDLGLHFGIEYTYLGDEGWKSYLFKDKGFKVNIEANHPVFLNGAFYFLDDGSGKLGVFKETEDMLLGKYGETFLNQVIDCPCESFHRKFLLKRNGKLLSIFVGFLGSFVRTFELDEANMVWLEVGSLGNHTLYLSRYSAFSTVATRGMQNRIYFPRYYGKSVVYYSLDSKQLHSHDSGEALKDFYNTREQLNCGWLSPRF